MNLIDNIFPKDNIIGMDFDPKTMLYLPESFEDCQKLIKSLSRSERKNLNCHIGHNTVGNALKTYLRDALTANSTQSMDSLHAASSAGAVANTDYDGEDGISWGESSDPLHVCLTTVQSTGSYYKDFYMEYDNSAGGALSITNQWIGFNGSYDDGGPSYDYQNIYCTAAEVFTVGAARKHFGFWKLTIA